MSNARRLGYRLLTLRAGGSLAAGNYGSLILLMDPTDGIFREVLFRLLEPSRLLLPPGALSAEIKDMYVVAHMVKYKCVQVTDLQILKGRVFVVPDTSSVCEDQQMT